MTSARDPIGRLLQAAADLATALPDGSTGGCGRASCDPCDGLLAGPVVDRSLPDPDRRVPAAQLSERLWELARAATTLRLRPGDLPEVMEATAALQDLAVDLADEASGAQRLAALTRLQAGVEPSVVVADDGPYLVSNLARLTDWLGQELPVRPQLALCRCGGSAIKPLCDGTHATNGFTGGKDPARVADRCDTYEGQQVTILDNRGTCQHSGHCTDRLATVFHLAEEPFVTPSGGRMDEIMRAVRGCPSSCVPDSGVTRLS